MSKHTPGPWDVTDDGRDDGKLTIHRRDEDVALVKSKDNARLIAAAPDMYEALKRVQLAARISDETGALVDAAIAKAEGR